MLIAEGEERVLGPKGPLGPRVKLADFGVSTLLASKDGAMDPAAAPLPAEPPKVRVGAGPLAELPADGNTMTISGRKEVAEAAAAELAAAQAQHADPRQLTQTGVLVGTPMYMAPELSEGSQRAQPSSDIFSLGMIAYELYSGELPFARPPVWARWRGTEAPAPPLADKRPELPAALVALIDSCLKLDPELRPTAAAIAAALRAFVTPN